MQYKWRFSLCVIMTAIVACVWTVFSGQDDHLWLRVEDGHIMTSPLADPPNQPFCPAGLAVDRGDSLGYQAAADLCWYFNLNTVRFLILTNGNHVLNTGEEWDMDEEIARIQRWLDIAKEYGLYTVLDNHQYFSRNVTYWNATELELWKSNWEKVAEAFKDNPRIIGYEPMNEYFPHEAFPAESIIVHMKECIARIRAIDTKSIIFSGNYSGTQQPEWDVVDPHQMMISWHPYPANQGLGSKAPEAAKEVRESENVGTLFTEFGAGTMANGFTWSHGAKWLQEFFDANKEHGFGWLNWYYRRHYPVNNDPNGERFKTMYGPDHPEIWIPAAREMVAKYPPPSNGVPDRLRIKLEPNWFPEFMAAGEDMTLTLRVEDVNGMMVSSSNAQINVTVSGAGTLVEAPSQATNGAAVVKIRADSPGDITVDASSSGLTGDQVSITSKKTWNAFQMQDTDNSWVDEGSSVGNASPSCRIQVQHPSKGVNLYSARYEYTTDGGSNWVYWDPAASDEFDGTMNVQWTAEDHNTTGGSANVANGALTIRAEGEDVFSEWNTNNWYFPKLWGHDEFFYVHEEKTGEFEVVTKITSQENVDPWGLSGIMVRDGMEDVWTNGYCYVAATPENGYVFGWKANGLMKNGGDRNSFTYIDAREQAGTVSYPCYLKLSKTFHPTYNEGTKTGYNRQYAVFSAYYSTDGSNWTKISSKMVIMSGITQRVGLFACSGKSGVYGETTFDFYRTHLKATTANARYSTGLEMLTTGNIPFDAASEYSQKVRYKIKTQVPYDHYMNHPGYDLVSPEYTVVSGIDVSAQKAAPGHEAPLALKKVSATRDGMRIFYSVPTGVSAVQLTVYAMDGRTIWSRTIDRFVPGTQSLVCNGSSRTGAPLAPGAYIVSMETLDNNATLSRARFTKTVMYAGK